MRTLSRRGIAGVCFVCLLFVLGVQARSQVSKGSAAAVAELDRGKAALKQKQVDEALAAFQKAVELDPLFFDAHSQLVSATYQKVGYDKRGEAREKLRAMYGAWLGAQPRNAVLHYFLGSFEESADRADAHYLQAVRIDPKFAQAYRQLSLNADMRGENEKSSKWLEKAAEATPGQPDNLFSYAYSLSERDPAAWTKLALRVVERFPMTERASQALYWLGEKAPKTADQVAYFERLRREYPAAKFSWSESAMQPLFDIYTRTDPEKALALAREIVAAKVESHIKWQDVATMQENVVATRPMIAQGQAVEGIALLEKTVVPKYVRVTGLHLARAEAENAAGQPEKAFERLADLVAAEPVEDLRDALLAQGKRMNRSAADVESSLRARREKHATVPEEFDLENYLDGSRASLARYRGKVVLLNFWYPG